jgi:hypothetical protein
MGWDQTCYWPCTECSRAPLLYDLLLQVHFLWSSSLVFIYGPSCMRMSQQQITGNKTRSYGVYSVHTIRVMRRLVGHVAHTGEMFRPWGMGGQLYPHKYFTIGYGNHLDPREYLTRGIRGAFSTRSKFSHLGYGGNFDPPPIIFRPSGMGGAFRSPRIFNP